MTLRPTPRSADRAPSWLASPKNGNISNVGQRLSEISLPSCSTYSERLTTVEVRFDGSADACKKFQGRVDWLIQYINKKVAEKK